MPDDIVHQPQIKISWLVGVAIALVLFVAIAGYSARMTHDYTDYDQTRAEARYDTLAKVREAEHKLIYPVDDQKRSTAAWVDQDKAMISIPIDEAMNKEITALKDRPPGSGCEINPPATAPAAPAPAALSTNAAPASPSAPAAKNPANGSATPPAAAAQPPTKK